MSRGLRLVVVQSAMPAYRQAFVDAVFDELGDDVEFLTGAEHYASGANTELEPDPRIRVVGNVYLLGRRALWQRGVVRDSVRAHTAVLEINPRTISGWAILFARGMLGRPTVLWGHAWSRKGTQSWTNRLRMFMCKLGAATIVYTESDRRELSDRLHVENVWAAPNAITVANEMHPAPAAANASNFVYSGRLVEDKKPFLALAGFVAALDRLPSESRLVVIGVGPLLDGLKREAAQSPAAGRVDFLGSVFDTGRLREVYSSAIASVSPGYVGLSMTQSHAFGLPMIYAIDEPHAPEIEAAREGINAIAVDSDDVEAFADAFASVYEDREHWSAIRDRISRDCRARYSVEAMTAGFLAAIKSTEPAPQIAEPAQ